jgi:hypothetical protein
MMLAVQKFVEAFVQNPDGSWFCRASVQFVGPSGPFTTTPGATYRRGQAINGYDIAAWLDDWQKHKRAPLGVAFG